MEPKWTQYGSKNDLRWGFFVFNTISLTVSKKCLTIFQNYQERQKSYPGEEEHEKIGYFTGVAELTCTCRRSPKRIQKKPKHRSKIDPKSIKSRCWKPSKSVFRFLGRFDASQIDFLTIFMNFSSKMPPEMDPKINQKSIPRPPGLSEGPLDGPRSLQDSILD